MDKVGEYARLLLHLEDLGLVEEGTVVAEHLLLHTELGLHLSPSGMVYIA